MTRVGSCLLLSHVCSGSIPEELVGLVKLEVLRLDDNELTGTVLEITFYGFLPNPENVRDAKTDDVRAGGPLGDVAHQLTARVRFPTSPESYGFALVMEGV